MSIKSSIDKLNKKMTGVDVTDSAGISDAINKLTNNYTPPSPKIVYLERAGDQLISTITSREIINLLNEGTNIVNFRISPSYVNNSYRAFTAQLAVDYYSDGDYYDGAIILSCDIGRYIAYVDANNIDQYATFANGYGDWATSEMVRERIEESIKTYFALDEQSTGELTSAHTVNELRDSLASGTFINITVSEISGTSKWFSSILSVNESGNTFECKIQKPDGTIYVLSSSNYSDTIEFVVQST